MSNFDEIFERIKIATKTRTQMEVAEMLGIRQSSISDAKRRNSIPSDWCMTLFERFGLNPDWVKKGTGPMRLRTEYGYAPESKNASLIARAESSPYADPNAQSVIMSVYSMQSCAETGQDNDTLEVVGKLNIPLSMAKTGVKVFLLDSAGMEPLLRKGAYIGVDTSQKRVVAGELYAVELPYEGVGIKRVFPDSAKATALLRTENPQHPEISLPFETLANAVMGRVIWTINRY